MQMQPKIGAVYLAAGNSIRFGSNKLLYPIEGKPMFMHGLSLLTKIVQEGVLDNLVVVTQYQEIMRYAKNQNLFAVLNSDSDKGISTSISLGLSFLSNTTDACLFLVADQPYVSKSSITRLITNWKSESKGIGCLSWKKKMGNPVLFSSHYYPELFSLTGDVGGKKIVKEHMEDVFLCEAMGERELTDLDTLTVV